MSNDGYSMKEGRRSSSGWGWSYPYRIRWQYHGRSLDFSDAPHELPSVSSTYCLEGFSSGSSALWVPMAVTKRQEEKWRPAKRDDPKDATRQDFSRTGETRSMRVSKPEGQCGSLFEEKRVALSVLHAINRFLQRFFLICCFETADGELESLAGDRHSAIPSRGVAAISAAGFQNCECVMTG